MGNRKRAKERLSMTAAAGADRIAKRLRRRAPHTERPQGKGGNPFRCVCCGGRNFVLEHNFVRVEVRTETLDCTCDPVSPDGAGGRMVTERWRCRTWQEIGSDHEVDLSDTGDDEELEDEEEDILDEGCPACVADADDEAWRLEDSVAEDVDDEQFLVYCEDCDHDIEFGWSDDGQKVWPCEARDFKPTSCVPDPQFEAAWAIRGWCRTTAEEGEVPVGVR